jgi:hypothetical protein
LALKTKTPSAFVEEAIFEPLTVMVAPERGESLTPVTMPVIFCCAKRVTPEKRQKNKRSNCFLLWGARRVSNKSFRVFEKKKGG